MTDYDPATPRHVVARDIEEQARTLVSRGIRVDDGPLGVDVQILARWVADLAHLFAASEHDAPQPLLGLISKAEIRQALDPPPEGTRVVLDLSTPGIEDWVEAMGFSGQDRRAARRFARALRDYGMVKPND